MSYITKEATVKSSSPSMREKKHTQSFCFVFVSFYKKNSTAICDISFQVLHYKWGIKKKKLQGSCAHQDYAFKVKLYATKAKQIVKYILKINQINIVKNKKKNKWMTSLSKTIITVKTMFPQISLPPDETVSCSSDIPALAPRLQNKYVQSII